MTPTREEIVKLLRLAGLREEMRANPQNHHVISEGALSLRVNAETFHAAADALEAAAPKGTRLASARGKLGDLFVEAGEAGLDKSGTEDFVREGFGEWVERTLAETLTAAPVLTFEEKVERGYHAFLKRAASSMSLKEQAPFNPVLTRLFVQDVLRAAGVEE